MRFGKDRSETLTLRLFSPKFPWVGLGGGGGGGGGAGPILRI